MRVLVACEYSGRVRDAFLARGHDAISVDLLPTEAPGPHITGDALEAIGRVEPELLIAFPPCTYLCRSGARWWNEPGRAALQAEALSFVRALLEADVPRIALENPPGAIGSQIRKADQYVQPWEHGHGEVKMTGLWLKGLPELVPTNVVDGREQACWKMGPSPERAKLRSLTYQGIADAMAEQWG